MNKKSILPLLSFVLLVFCFFGVTSSLLGDVTLAVPERIQQYSNWCWAGTSEAVLNYYGQYPSQCVIANFAWNTSKCCTGSTNFYDMVKGCNKANYLYGTSGSIEGIMAHWGVASVGTDNPLTWTQNVTELNNGHPYFMRWGWTGGGGHFLVPYGYITTGSYLQYMDPWPGEGYTTSLFSYVVSASDHDWTHTLTTY
jgi:hypothetical protein